MNVRIVQTSLDYMCELMEDLKNEKESEVFERAKNFFDVALL